MQQNYDPKPHFRNTRSRFFKRKSTRDNQFSENLSEENTGAYWKKKGNDHYAQSQINQAIEAYSKAIELNSGQSIYFSNRARCYKHLGKIDLALKDAEQACQLDQMNIKAHYICGCILAEQAKYDQSKLPKASNRLKKALRLCSTLKKSQFSDQISIKLFRLKKLEYLINETCKLQKLNEIQKSLMHSNSQINGKILENIREQIQQMKKKQIPSYMFCTITLEIMEDPVTTEAGFTYEKSAIQDTFANVGCIDPNSRLKVSPKLYPNQALKEAIRQFMEQNPWAFEYTHEQQYSSIQF